MKPEDLEAMNQDPAHWRLGFFYFAPKDPRLLVRGRIRSLGWTINFARPMAVPFVVAMIAFAYGYLEILSRLHLPDSFNWAGVFLLIVLLVSVCSWLSNPHRHAL